MRVFIGIKLDSPSQIKIEKFLQSIKKNSSPLKWVPSSNLHLTLKFIGDISLEQLNLIISTIEKNQHILIHKMRVKTFQVFKSTLTPAGSIYSIIKEIPLC